MENQQLSPPAILWESDCDIRPNPSSSSTSPFSSPLGREESETPPRQEKKRCYWTDEILHLFRPQSSTAARSSAPPTLSSVSYETLFNLSAATAIELLEEYIIKSPALSMLPSNNSQSLAEFGVPVAVAIPEGPLLPLAALVFHALNAINSRFYTVLVPIEPSEAIQRNRHIVDDARPLLVLAVPDCPDWDRLQQIIRRDDNEREKPSSEGCASCQVSSDGLLVNSRPPEIVDFCTLVRIARRRWISTTTSTISQTIQEQLISMSDISLDAMLKYSRAETDLRESKSNIQRLMVSLMHKIRKKNMLSSTDSSSNKEDMVFQPCTSNTPRISHIVYTSGTTGRPKGCISSTPSLCHYIHAKNNAHGISCRSASRVLLASSLSFDPCLSDIIATLEAGATLCIVPRTVLTSNLPWIISSLRITHMLCTPTLWSLVSTHHQNDLKMKCSDVSSTSNGRFPSLQCVALGGEPIPRRILYAWARPSSEKEISPDKLLDIGPCGLASKIRLVATYGVTEACVYQTWGEVFCDVANDKGQYVGRPFDGVHVRICREEVQESLVDVADGSSGEVVLYGAQLDQQTRYMNRPELDYKFVAQPSKSNDNGRINYHYRTGDRGSLNPDGSLNILGRIVGEEGMIKINGVRVELAEIEAAIMDQNVDSIPPVVIDCLCTFTKDEQKSTIYSYVVIDNQCRKEMGLPQNGRGRQDAILINDGPLWTLLHTRCSSRLKVACIPSFFIAISSLPLSPTGKRNRDGVPSLDECHLLNERGDNTTLLRDYGSSGALVADTLAEYLNLHECQQRLLSTKVSFAMLGGDSLSATIVCRTLYAKHHQIKNNRFIGGNYGQFPEPFNAANLLRAESMGEYVDLLDRHGVCCSNDHLSSQLDTMPVDSSGSTKEYPSDAERSAELSLYDALLQAVTLGQRAIAVALLYEGADPNSKIHGGRIGKTSGRIAQRAIFKGNPLHLACNKADLRLIIELVRRGAKVNVPNTNGLFPIHLVASGLIGDSSTREEALIRCECAKVLFEAGSPFLMRDANRQSILHCAARAGHTELVIFFMNECKSQFESRKIPMSPDEFLNWSDHWHRAPIHWAVLNGRVETLKVLLELGADPSPRQPTMKKKSSLRSSVELETPIEICDRLYENTPSGSEMKQCLLDAVGKKRSKTKHGVCGACS